MAGKISLLTAVGLMSGLPLNFHPALGEARDNSQQVEMVMKDVPLSVALRLIAENHGYGFESQLPLDNHVTLDMSGITFEDAVHRLLSGKPCEWAVEDNILKVRQASQPASGGNLSVNPDISEPVVQPPVATDEKRILILKNRRPDEIVALLTPIVGEVKLMPDVRTNAILMSGSKEALKKVTAMAIDLDSIETVRGMEDKREFLSEVFALDYISDFADLESNLNFILYGSTQSTTSAGQNITATQVGGQMVEQPVVPIRREYYLLDKIRRLLMITASRDKMEIIREYFTRVNSPLPQVLIEAHIVALDSGFERSAGLNWNFVGSYQGPIKPTDRPLGTPQQTVGGTAIDAGQGFEFGKWNLGNLVATLELAEANNKGKILSQPRLMTLSGNEARIHIGTRYPYKSATTLNQSGGTAENIQYVDVGILLNVTPQVNTKSGTIVMKLAPEVSDVVGFRNDAPIITSRQTNTVVEVSDGETVVIGGLLRDEDLKSKTGVPILKEIPVIGEFFRYSKKTSNKTNLVIMITPKVVTVKGKTLKEAELEEKEAKSAQKSADYQELVEQLRKKVEEKN